MSTLNVSTIYAEYVNTTGNVFIGNLTSNVAFKTDNTILVGSNVFINSTYISVGNSTINSQINATAITVNRITLNGTLYLNTSFDYQTSNYQSFTANGTWTKPSWAAANDLVTVMLWSGGGGGGAGGSSANGGGGGGGACVFQYLLASSCNATCAVFVGLGGTGGSSSGADGGNSRFTANSTNIITAYGGGGGSQAIISQNGYGLGGGGWFVPDTPFNFGSGCPPLGGANTATGGDSTFGGGGGGRTGAGGVSVYGGGGGGLSNGGASIYGGGGGAGGAGTAGGISRFGGNGGLASTGFAPGGGGAGGGVNINGFAGARGEVRVWVQKVT
jgi:hypothetical protein